MSEATKLGELWSIRNAAANTLILSEAQMRQAVREATVDQLVTLIEMYSPARSTGTEWTRTFEPLVERLWAWCEDDTMAALADVFKARGMPWMAVANSFMPEHGARIRASLRQPAWARMPAFVIA
ncbi:MAG: hypothetical protein AB7P40_00715 [Chloroflexota bacterium]